MHGIGNHTFDMETPWIFCVEIIYEFLYSVYNLSFIISIDLWSFEIASRQARFRDCNVIPLEEVREFLSAEMRLELRFESRERVTQLFQLNL